jgi:hypothetical protein
MNKNFYLLLTIFSLMAACSSDDDSPMTDGRYVYVNGSVTAQITFGERRMLTVYQNGVWVYQADIQGRVVGEWPNYSYTYYSGYSSAEKYAGTVTADCSFTSRNSFSANISTDIADFPVAGKVTFTHTNDVLDSNGDGILDSWQQL